MQASSHAAGGVRSAVSNAADGVSSFGRCALESTSYRWTPENLRCTICLRDVDGVEELRVLPTAPMQVRFCAGECAPVPSEGVPGAGAEHERLEIVYGALRAALLDRGLSAEQRAPYTEAAARVVTRQLEFTGAALVPQSE